MLANELGDSRVRVVVYDSRSMLVKYHNELALRKSCPYQQH